MTLKTLIPFLFASILFVSCLQEDSFECESEINLDVDQAQLTEDIEAIDAYLADSSIVAVEDPTGLRYVINRTGNGVSPTLCNIITVDYKAILLDNGEIIDQSTNPVSFSLAGLITGWEIGLPKVTNGGSITLYVPSVYAYGSEGRQNIPPNSNLIFEIDLFRID